MSNTDYYKWLDKELKLLQSKCINFKKDRSKNYTLIKILKENCFKTCLEFGVFKGHTINIISKFCNKVYGFDSFEGLPKDWNGVCKKEHFKINELPKVDKNTILIKGWFNETLDIFLTNNPDIIIDLIHIDCDLYVSTKVVFDILIKHNKLKKDLIIVFDELINYNKFYEGEIKALYDINQNNNINFEWLYTHGDVILYKDMIKTHYQKMSFKDFRNKGYQQEVAIKII